MINDRYSIIKLLGEGRSKVFLCEDKFYPTQKQAIKILPSQISQDEEESFISEYNLLKNFSHPSIIKAFEAGTIVQLTAEEDALGIKKGSRFFTLEYFDGQSLLDIDFVSKPVLLSKAIGRIASFLTYLHLANHIYFDLKLENILCFQVGNNVVIKIIDFGLVRHLTESLQTSQRGTAHYLAPEILQNKSIDHRVDLYSLGILLYRLVYGKFPFEADDELKIYHLHLDEEVRCADSPHFSEAITKTIAQLLIKNPNERIQSAVQLFQDLHLPLEDYYLDFISSTQFVGRNGELRAIEEYVEDSERTDVYVFQGILNSGKSSLAEKLAGDISNSVLIGSLPSNDPHIILKYIASKIIFSLFFSAGEIQKFSKILKEFNAANNLSIENSTALFAEICKANQFILLIDDFNVFDEVAKEVLYHILPVLQVSGCKIILFEDQSSGSSVEAIANKTVYVLPPLLPEDVSIFLQQNYSGSFPQKQLAPLIEKYADLFPGNILLFLNELIANQILIFTGDTIYVDENKVKQISAFSQEALFEERIALLSTKEKNVLQLLSSLDVELSFSQTEIVLKSFSVKIDEFLPGLQKNNLLHVSTLNSQLQFVSPGLKLFVYGSIENKVSHHKKLAVILSAIPDFSPNELSRHYELAEDFDEAYLCLKPELHRAIELTTFLYAAKLFTRLVSFSLSEKYAIEVRQDFLRILQKTGDNETALRLLNELESKFHLKIDAELSFQKGVFLIASGKVEEGKKLLVDLADKMKDGLNKNEILLEIASANLNTNLYSKTESVLTQLLESKDLTSEQRGKVFNMNGLLALYKNNNIEKAFSSFTSALNEFTDANLKQRIARVEVNLGNLCSMMGDYDQAEKYWKSSLTINNAIGDLEQEALLLMNYGIYFFDKADYEKALNSYKNAKNIFQTIGKKNGLGLTLLNAGETHLIACDYSSALEEFQAALKIFRSTENEEEEASADYFLAKTYIIVGDAVEAKNYTEHYSVLIENGKLGEKHQLQLKFIMALADYYFNDTTKSQTEEDMLSLCNTLLETDNRYDAVLASMIYVDNCITEEKYQTGFSLLTGEKYLELSSGNNIYKAVRSFLLGKLERHERFGEKPFIDYFNEAYQILKDESITEFTRLALSMLGKIYFERNLFSKAQDFFILTEGLITFLSNNISDDSLRRAYLAKKERAEDLQFIQNGLSSTP